MKTDCTDERIRSKQPKSPYFQSVQSVQSVSAHFLRSYAKAPAPGKKDVTFIEFQPALRWIG
jgi:hypothetical protein